MKKLLLFLSFIFIFPAWALCPVESGESVCSLSDMSSPSNLPLFKIQNEKENGSEENMDSSAVKSVQPTGFKNTKSKRYSHAGKSRVSIRKL